MKGKPVLRQASLKSMMAAAIFLAGCGELRTISAPLTEDSTAARNGAEPGGLVYGLPYTVLRIDGKLEATPPRVTYTITPIILADPAARFRARFNPSGWADNSLDVTVNAEGLLTSGSATIADQRGAIVVEAARLAGQVGGLRGFGLLPPSPPGTPTPPSPYPFSVTYTADQLASASGQALPDMATIRLIPPPREATAASTPPRCDLSLCYRPMTTVFGEISRPSSPTPLANRFALSIVDTSRVEGVQLVGAALVTRSNTLTFNNGVLTRHQINQPSSALALASVPTTALGAFTKALSEVLTIRVDQATSDAQLVQQQAALLEARVKLLQAEQALQAAAAQNAAR